MEKFQLDKHMKESIEFMIKQRGNTSIYGILDNISCYDSDSVAHGDFAKHAININKYFNDLDTTEDDNNFMKCLMGHYEIKTSPEEEILTYYQQMLVDKHSSDYERRYVGEQGCEAIEFVLGQLGRMDIIMKPQGDNIHELF